jgi:hypothetical protein
MAGLFFATVRDVCSRNGPLAMVFAKMAPFIHD